MNSNSRWTPVAMALIIVSLLATPFEMAMAQGADPDGNVKPTAPLADVSSSVHLSAGNAIAQAIAQGVTRGVTAPSSRPAQDPKGKARKRLLIIAAAAGVGVGTLILTRGREQQPPASIEVLSPTIGPQQ